MINGEAILQAKTTKFLGVYLDEKLDWKCHIDALSSKIAKNIGIINKLRYKLSQSTLVTLYNILIQPHLYYCTILWGGAYSSTLLRLQRLQKRAMRVLTFSKYIAHADPLFVKLKKLKIKKIYKFQVLLYMYKCKLGVVPNGQIGVDQFMLRNFNSYDMRNNHMRVPYFRTNIPKMCIKYSGPLICNSLPLIQNKFILNEYSFKRCLRDYFLNDYGV